MNLDRQSLKCWISRALSADGRNPVVFEPDQDPRNATRPKQVQCLSSVTVTGRLATAAAAGGAKSTAADEAEVRVTIKLKPFVEQLRAIVKSDRQFYNEIYAYQHVVPFLQEHLPDDARGPTLPTFVFGRNDSGGNWHEDMIVLQDPWRADDGGYSSARCDRDRPFLDYEHLALAIGALGRFHGMSYTAKQKNPVAFRKLVGHLREIQWDEDGWLVKGNGLKSLGMRGARPLMDQDQYRDGKLKGFLSMIREADRNLKLAMTPKEPFAVICHGDYCKPNILFKYDEHGHPRDAMITELTAVRYALLRR